MSIPSRIQRPWLDIEPLSDGYGGYNLYLQKIENEKQGPKVGWISHRIAVIVDSELLKEWLSRQYTRWYPTIIERGYQDLARKMMRRREDEL